MTGILVLICCILCGFCVGLFLQRRQTEQVAFLTDLTNYLSLLRVNVDGKRLPLPQFDSQFCQRAGESFKQYLCGNKSVPLSATDGKIVASFFDGLKCNTGAELVRHIEYYQQVFAQVSARYLQNAEKQRGMYIKLGVLLGAMIGVLFV